MAAHYFQTYSAAESLCAFLEARGGSFAVACEPQGYAVARETRAYRPGFPGAAEFLSACDVQDARDAGFEFPEFQGVQP